MSTYYRGQGEGFEINDECLVYFTPSLAYAAKYAEAVSRQRMCSEIVRLEIPDGMISIRAASGNDAENEIGSMNTQEHVDMVRASGFDAWLGTENGNEDVLVILPEVARRLWRMMTSQHMRIFRILANSQPGTRPAPLPAIRPALMSAKARKGNDMTTYFIGETRDDIITMLDEIRGIAKERKLLRFIDAGDCGDTYIRITATSEQLNDVLTEARKQHALYLADAAKEDGYAITEKEIADRMQEQEDSLDISEVEF